MILLNWPKISAWQGVDMLLKPLLQPSHWSALVIQNKILYQIPNATLCDVRSSASSSSFHFQQKHKFQHRRLSLIRYFTSTLSWPNTDTLVSTDVGKNGQTPYRKMNEWADASTVPCQDFSLWYGTSTTSEEIIDFMPCLNPGTATLPRQSLRARLWHGVEPNAVLWLCCRKRACVELYGAIFLSASIWCTEKRLLHHKSLESGESGAGSTGTTSALTNMLIPCWCRSRKGQHGTALARRL